ncbi:MAG: DNA-processing protein DprA [Sphingobacteriaceae bacterium]|nr:MAG: DNA-processing protein DprA [Sphingobacteriaceae bacterium]
MVATLENLIYLTYLTNYNVGTIYYCLENAVGGSPEELAVLASQKKSASSPTSDKNIHDVIEKAKQNTKEAIDRLTYHNIKAITFIDANYPKQLHNLNDKPPVLYLKGELPKKQELAAVVGSREVSTNAATVTNIVVDVLSQCGFGIVSGLALGIDTLAHERALDCKQYTMAVMPNSLERVYPHENYKLAKRIEDSGGALVSELIFNINRGKSSFVQRNRIQSGLSSVVVPIEMGAQSGTMHTIDFAMRQKKEVILLSRTKYSKFSEGISVLIDKYSDEKYTNVHVLKNVSEFAKHIMNVSGRNIGIQARLF